MKNVLFFGVMLAVMAGPSANAGGCDDDGYTNRLSAQQIANRLSNRRVLATGSGGGDWKEDHCSTDPGVPGALYKVGAGTTVDPRAFRGTWTPRAGGDQNPPRVVYNYTVGGSSSFAFSVWRNNTTNGLCWEDLNGQKVAVAPAPQNIPGGPCDIP